MSTPNEPTNPPAEPGAQEPAEGSRDTVDAALRNDQGASDQGAFEETDGVSDEVPDA
jgi:hypothetical protein